MKLTIVVVSAMLQAYEYYFSVYQVLRDVLVSILLLNTGITLCTSISWSDLCYSLYYSYIPIY